MKIFLPGRVCSHPKSQRSLGDLISLCKREAVPPGPRRSCQAQTWPAPGSPSSTCHARRPPFRGGGPFSPSVRPGSRGSGTREALAAASLPAPLHPAPRRGSPAHPPRLRQSKARAGATGSARRPRPPASLWPAAPRPVAPLSVARADPCGDRRVAGALPRATTARRRGRQPRGRRPPWTSRTVSAARGAGRRGGRAAGGLRRGSVYRLKMAVWLCSAGRAAPAGRGRGRGRGPVLRGCAAGRGAPPPPGCSPNAARGVGLAASPAGLRAPASASPRGRLQLPGLARRGRPGARGAAAGWRAGGRVEPSLLTARPGLGRRSASPREASVKRSIGVGFIHPPAPQSPPPEPEPASSHTA